MRYDEFKKMVKSANLEQIRSHLAFEMISEDSPKQEKCKDCPHIVIQDMNAIPIIWAEIDDRPGSLAKLLVTKELCRYFSVSSEEMIRMVQDETAKKLMPLSGLQSVMMEQFGESLLQGAMEETLFLATTNDLHFGASVICTHDFFKNAAKQLGGNYYLLPSSVHEVLLARESNIISPREFQQLVGEVNREVVEVSERLTDNAYHYDARKNLLETAIEYEARLEKERELKKDRSQTFNQTREPDREEPQEEEELEP